MTRFECTEIGPCSQNCSPSSMAHILRPIPCPGLCGPILHPHFSPSTLQRVSAVSHHLCRLASFHPGEAGWPWPCFAFTRFLHFLNQSPGTFPRTPTAMARRLESWGWKTVPLRPEVSASHCPAFKTDSMKTLEPGPKRPSLRDGASPHHGPRLICTPSPFRIEVPQNLTPWSPSLFLPIRHPAGEADGEYAK